MSSTNIHLSRSLSGLSFRPVIYELFTDYKILFKWTNSLEPSKLNLNSTATTN